MKLITREEFFSQVQKAPQAVREVVQSSGMIEIIMNVGKKYGLHIDQMSVLADLTSYMLVGLVNPNEFQSELVAQGMSSENTEKVIQEINQQIFLPLRDKMM